MPCCTHTGTFLLPEGHEISELGPSERVVGKDTAQSFETGSVRKMRELGILGFKARFLD